MSDKFKKLGGGGDVRHTPRQKVSRGEKRAAECRLATLNVQGGVHEKLDEVLELMNDKRLDALCLNETKKREWIYPSRVPSQQSGPVFKTPSGAVRGWEWSSPSE